MLKPKHASQPQAYDFEPMPDAMELEGGEYIYFDAFQNEWVPIVEVR